MSTTLSVRSLALSDPGTIPVAVARTCFHPTSVGFEKEYVVGGPKEKEDTSGGFNEEERGECKKNRERRESQRAIHHTKPHFKLA